MKLTQINELFCIQHLQFTSEYNKNNPIINKSKVFEGTTLAALKWKFGMCF